MSYVDSILERVKKQNPNEPEFNQVRPAEARSAGHKDGLFIEF